MNEKTQTIRKLNDRFRQGDSTVPGQIFITRGLTDLLEEVNKSQDDLLYPVQTFSQFTQENDPHGEHDFGSFEFAQHTCFWKFDYYDPTLKWGSDDPSDVAKTMRVLTIMLAEEY